MEHFGQILKQLRQAKNLSLRDVGKKSGIAYSYLSLVEQGKRPPPSMRLLIKLEDAFNLQHGDLCSAALTFLVKLK